MSVCIGRRVSIDGHASAERQEIKDVLGEKVSKERLTHCLIESPVCLVVDACCMSLNRLRIMKNARRNFGMGRKILKAGLGIKNVQ